MCDGDNSILCVNLCALYPILSAFSLTPYPYISFLGMLYHMELDPTVAQVLITETEADYLHSTLSLLRSAETGTLIQSNPTTNSNTSAILTVTDVRREVCRQSHRLYNQIDTLVDWNKFLANVV